VVGSTERLQQLRQRFPYLVGPRSAFALAMGFETADDIAADCCRAFLAGGGARLLRAHADDMRAWQKLGGGARVSGGAPTGSQPAAASSADSSNLQKTAMDICKAIAAIHQHVVQACAAAWGSSADAADAKQPMPSSASAALLLAVRLHATARQPLERRRFALLAGLRHLAGVLQQHQESSSTQQASEASTEDGDDEHDAHAVRKIQTQLLELQAAWVAGLGEVQTRLGQMLGGCIIAAALHEYSSWLLLLGEDQEHCAVVEQLTKDWANALSGADVPTAEHPGLGSTALAGLVGVQLPCCNVLARCGCGVGLEAAANMAVLQDLAAIEAADRPLLILDSSNTPLYTLFTSGGQQQWTLIQSGGDANSGGDDSSFAAAIRALQKEGNVAVQLDASQLSSINQCHQVERLVAARWVLQVSRLQEQQQQFEAQSISSSAERATSADEGGSAVPDASPAPKSPAAGAAHQAWAGRLPMGCVEQRLVLIVASDSGAGDLLSALPQSVLNACTIVNLAGCLSMQRLQQSTCSSSSILIDRVMGNLLLSRDPRLLRKLAAVQAAVAAAEDEAASREAQLLQRLVEMRAWVWMGSVES